MAGRCRQAGGILLGAADNLLYTERGKLAALIGVRTSVPEQKFKDYEIVVVVAWK
ncbi:hypothetical protein J2Z49_001001 [Desulfofundulus luciae]|uniref:Uncharacterized protein n=1 Tax=Desulfofundulus luciae TaxID=74702 RepID=A0ABU0AZK6_9FIRM|nr:hypothetical protein [Desulfofundulus luciae]MDQ0285896.1 hypothetical protein [Desulfofundulus luciae]